MAGLLWVQLLKSGEWVDFEFCRFTGGSDIAHFRSVPRRGCAAVRSPGAPRYSGSLTAASTLAMGVDPMCNSMFSFSWSSRNLLLLKRFMEYCYWAVNAKKAQKCCDEAEPTWAVPWPSFLSAPSHHQRFCWKVTKKGGLGIGERLLYCQQNGGRGRNTRLVPRGDRCGWAWSWQGLITSAEANPVFVPSAYDGWKVKGLGLTGALLVLMCMLCYPSSDERGSAR